MARKETESHVNSMACLKVVLPTRNGGEKVVAEGFFPDEETAKNYAAKKLAAERIPGWKEKFVVSTVDV